MDPYSPYSLMDGFKKELGKDFTFVDERSILARARSVKNSEEIKVIRRAAGLASAMIVAAKAAVKEGVREIEVASEATRRLLELEPLAHPITQFTVMSGKRAAYNCL